MNGGDSTDHFNERIALIVKDQCSGNRSEFARRLGITPAYAAQMYNGSRIPSDRTIADICREFNIRREWLETGEGPMHLPEIDMDMGIVNDLIADAPAPAARFVKKFLKTYLELSPDRQAVMDDFLRRLLDEQ